MNELELSKVIEWWCLQSTHPYRSDEDKKSYQDKLNKVMKFVEKLDG